MIQNESLAQPKVVKSALKKSFVGNQSAFSDFQAMEAQFNKEGGKPLCGEIEGNTFENIQDGNQERRDKRGNEIKKGVQYRITFKDQIRRIKSGEIYRENIEDLIEKDEEDEDSDDDEEETENKAYSDQDESPNMRKQRLEEEQGYQDEDEEQEQQQEKLPGTPPQSKHYQHRAKFKKGKRQALEDVIYVESYKEYNANNPYTNTCCCIL